MKIAIVHLSDFHIRAGDQFLSLKTNGILSALNILGKVDDYIVVFSGDLSNSGQVNEFKQSRYLLGKIISGIKQKNDNKFINLFMVPGNHDLCLPKNVRVREDIQEHYDNETIEDLIPAEVSYLENYYSYSNVNGKIPYDIFLSKKYCTFDGYKMQFNLINTAPFSTLEPDDKELHYFPDSKIHALARSNDTNLCITVMHHSYEWFNWNYKSNLEKAIIDNSEFLLCGHDHREHTTSMSIDNSLDTWISSAGEMKFSSLDKIDSFNTIVIDTETSISSYAGDLLEPWAAINFSEKNISLLHNTPLNQINPPSDAEQKAYEDVKEKSEEENYSEEIIEARGLFDYNDKDIGQYQYRIARAVKYTEIICKALPAFHSNLRLKQKNELVESIYLYPRKIVYALLHPFDINKREICDDILNFVEKNNISKKNGQKYKPEDILIMLNDSARAIMLGMFDHFSELATSYKSFDWLMEKKMEDISEQLERLLMIENIGNTDRLVKEADSLLKKYL